MREIRNMRVSLLADRDSPDVSPKVLEIACLLHDRETNMQRSVCEPIPIDEVDLAKSLAETYSDCIARISSIP